MNKEHIMWIDCAKGFAMLLVIIGHVFNGFLNGGYYTEQGTLMFWINEIIYSFHMPLFFIISGYLYEHTWNRNTPLRIRLKNKLIDLGIMYVIFSIAIWFIKYCFSNTVQLNKTIGIADLFLIPIKPIEYLWFLYVLLLIYMLVPICFQILKNNYIVLSVFITITFVLYTFSLHEGPFSIIYLVFYNTVYFLIGIILYQYEKAGILYKKKFLLGAVSISAFYWFSYSMYGSDSLFFKYLIALTTTYVVYYAVKYCDSNKSNHLWYPYVNLFFSYLGANSLPLYILHVYFLALFRTLLYKLGVHNFTISTFIMILVGVMGPLIAKRMFDSNKYTYFIFQPLKTIQSWSKK